VTRGLAVAAPLVALGALLGGCGAGDVGTIDLELTAAPGSMLLDGVARLRVTLTAPRQVVEAPRTGDGFAIALEVDATGALGSLIVEGFDDTGGLVAAGQSPPFAVAAIDAHVVVYMAAPMSVGPAPVALAPARANVSATAISYGAVLAGGRDAAGAPSDAIALYNAYDHTLASGKPMPAPRDGVALATTRSGFVYLFGGRDAAGTPQGALWLFDTNFAPSGAYTELGERASLARADQIAVPFGPERFLVTGAPAFELASASVTERPDVPALAATGATQLLASGELVGVLVAESGELLRADTGTFAALPGLTRPGAAVAALGRERVFAVIGGGTPDEANDVHVVDVATGTTTTATDRLASPRVGASVAVTARHVVIVGGGAPTAEILDATTLEPVAVHDTGAHTAIALPNDQVLLVGDGGVLELFTPSPPALP